jgi:hypothetical protein
MTVPATIYLANSDSYHLPKKNYRYDLDIEMASPNRSDSILLK